ncbi:LytR/AlgR family response regulator transcription factor [Dethiothermospora halolimnae]|uniref:LytR/AlgR family response regulator transcription factor n=1 Tax=Dethiothermospora halolimnae TaxID=3114390 RepID=UPI003CCB7CA7
MTLKVLIADDDSGMRLVLKKVIKKIDGFQLVGEADNGLEALEMAESENPDVVFLDIEMPKLSGIECAKSIIDINPKTAIIFATAHEEYMGDAFELYAFDYLTKPFRLDRVYKTLRRIKDVNNKSNEEDNISEALDKLIIKNKDGISFVDTKDIILIQREDRSTVVYTKDQGYVTSESLTDLEEKLEGTTFLRSHKSYIINLSKIKRVTSYGRWTYSIEFTDTHRDALITHKKYKEIEKIFITGE